MCNRNTNSNSEFFIFCQNKCFFFRCIQISFMQTSYDDFYTFHLVHCETKHKASKENFCCLSKLKIPISKNIIPKNKKHLPKNKKFNFLVVFWFSFHKKRRKLAIVFAFFQQPLPLTLRLHCSKYYFLSLFLVIALIPLLRATRTSS